MLSGQQYELKKYTVNQNKLSNTKNPIYTNGLINQKLYETPDKEKLDSFKYDCAYEKNYNADSINSPNYSMCPFNTVNETKINAFDSNIIDEVCTFNDVGNSINLQPSGENMKKVKSSW